MQNNGSILMHILYKLARLDRKMATLDQASQDMLSAITALPALITQAVNDAVAAANSGNSAALQAALQDQQSVADALEKGVTDLNAAVAAADPGAPVVTPTVVTPPVVPAPAVTTPVTTGSSDPNLTTGQDNTPGPVGVTDAASAAQAGIPPVS